MSHPYIQSIQHLMPLFRIASLWLNIVIIAFAIFLFWPFGLIVLSITVLAAIFNLVALLVELRARKRLSVAGDRLFAPVKIWTVVVDFLAAFAFLILFALTITASIVQFGGYEAQVSGQGRLSILGAQTYAGLVVAWHSHFVFAGVSLHLWRQQKKGLKAQTRTQRRMENDVELTTGA